MKKRIDHILEGREKQITKEETVRQPLPHSDFRFANPFIVLHHLGPSAIAPGQELRIHPHPHRGFSPVTFQLQGEGYHKDSAGHNSVIKAGDVQWMFAGKGILHSEGPTANLLQKGGTQELLQLWVNVPKSHNGMNHLIKRQPGICSQVCWIRKGWICAWPAAHTRARQAR